MKNGYITCVAFVSLFFGVTSCALGQDTRDIFLELKAKDSLLFSLVFNTCDTAQLRDLISDDFEFYHDRGGITDSRERFLAGIPGMCQMNYKARRELAVESLQVFPLYDNGVLYGAVQTGMHRFYGKEEGKPEYLTSTALFTHLWIIEGGDWKLKRVLSYDHQTPAD